MDLTAETESIDPFAVRLEGLTASIGEKRPIEVEEDGEFGLPSRKKARSRGGLIGNMKKVAEIVLVLAVMGKMRAGKSPTAAEKEMMQEARGKLVQLCEEFAPKDVFPRDAFGAVIEDLGLSKSREQRLGFRPPKMSIAEKLLLTKQKMGKSGEFSLRSAAYSSQRLRMNSSAVDENRGKLDAIRIFPSDKQSHATNSSGRFQPASPLGHVSAASSTSLPYQLPASEVRPSMASNVLPSNHLGRDSSSVVLPRVERTNFRLDGRSNGSSYTSQVEANSSGNHAVVKTPTWSLQSQSVASTKLGPDCKVLAHTSLKVGGTVDSNTSHEGSQATSSKPVTAQTTSGNLPNMHQHLQGMNFAQAPLLYNGHNEIVKIIQKLLQSQPPEHPTWIPPSRDYMNKALTCQMCKLMINDVESVLVCDTCEKGFHLKCLQSNNQKGIPKGEWHCQRCLMLTNGKLLPPKYGRVTRNINAQKLPSETPASQSSPDKKVDTLDVKIHQQKLTANGNSSLQSVHPDTIGNNNNPSTSGSNIPNARETQGYDISSGKEQVEDKPVSETYPNNVTKSSEVACVSSAGSSLDRSCKQKLISESTSQASANLSETVSNSLDHSGASNIPQDNDQTGLPTSAEIPSGKCHANNLVVNDSSKSYSRETFDCNPNYETKQDKQGLVDADSFETSGSSNGAREHASSSSDGLHDVGWIGHALQVVDDKTYYQSCCINRIVYKLQDHALFYSNNKLIPSKIQAMLEDSKTKSKWLIVSRCYFPDDLPKIVGCPCTLESNEVYESNHNSTIMAGLIQGPCKVLPPRKFFEESERRNHRGANDGLLPLFLCQWFYDEPKAVFRDVSS